MSSPSVAAADNELEWRAIATMTRLADGFTLGFVVSDLPVLLDETPARLAAALGEAAVATVTLRAGADDADLLALIGEAAKPEGVRVVLVRGADAVLDPHGERSSAAFARLNFNRSSLAVACPKPLVLLLSTWAMRELVRSAPDLWSWRSGLYRLGASAEEVGDLLASLPVDAAADVRSRRETRRVLRHLAGELEGADERLELEALLRLGRVESLLGDYDAATEHYDRALQIATGLGNRTTEANSLLGLADIARMLGDLDAATEHYDRALQIATGLGDRTTEANSLLGLADIALMRGDLDAATEHLDRALQIAKGLGQRTNEANSLLGLANIARMRGDYDTATEHYDRALQIATGLGQRTNEANSLLGLAEIARMRGDHDAATEHYDR
ncbi:MAG: tetratricopeptide repeat protein, partial [Solirubrobacterales bacterium]|nr:tetratricopeptide repeat protein [Solirubrobacterales bacterium]